MRVFTTFLIVLVLSCVAGELYAHSVYYNRLQATNGVALDALDNDACDLFGGVTAESKRDWRNDPQQPRNNNLKVTIMSIFSGSLKLTYERHTVKNQSIEMTAGVIGPAFDILKHSHPHGGLCRVAYKFIFPIMGYKPLEGFYIKPELAFSSYSYYNRDVDARLHVNKMGIMAVGGYQWVRKWFVFDIFLGPGFGIGNSNLSNYHHGFLSLNLRSPMVYTAGFKVGVAF